MSASKYVYIYFIARYAYTQPKSSLSELIKNLTLSSCSHSDIDFFSNKYCRLCFSPIPQQGYTNYQSPRIFVWTVTDSATEHQAFHLCVDVHCAIFQAATNPWVNDGPRGVKSAGTEKTAIGQFPWLVFKN